MNLSNIVGEKVRILREFRGYSQEYMAMNMDISQSAYSKIEAGKCTLTIDRLKDISELLEVEISELLSIQKDSYYLQNNHIANAHQHTINLNYDQKMEAYVEHLKQEIYFLRNLLKDKEE